MKQHKTFFQVTGEILKFSLPLSAAGINNVLSSVAAMLMVARLGKAPLAAAALGLSTYLPLMTLVITTLYGIGILIGHSRADNDDAKIGLITRNGFLLAVVLSLPAAFLLWFIEDVLIFFKQDPALVILTIPYFHYAAFSLIISSVLMVIAQFFVGIGNARFSFFSTAIRLPFTIVLSYCLILGKWGFPQMGLAGAMAAPVYVQLVFSLLLFVYLILHHDAKRYHLFRMTLFEKNIFKKLIQLGFPIGIQFSTELAAMAVSVYFMGQFGTDALAASQVISQYVVIFIMFILGLTQAAGVLVSTSLGEKNFKRIVDIKNASIFISLVGGLGIFLIFALFPRLLLSLFINIHEPMNRELVNIALPLFLVAGFILLIDGLRNVLSGCLRGLHLSAYAMWAGVICLWAISLPAAYLVGFHFHEGPVGLRLGVSIGFIVCAIVLWKRLQQFFRS